MLEPGVVRFGLGPLTEVVAQHHTFDELAPHLDATLLPVVAQERVLRGEDLRDDERAFGAPDDPLLVLQPFEPDYVLPEYRATERLDGAVPDPIEAGTPDVAPAVAAAATPGAAPAPAVTAAPGSVPARLVRALEDVVAPWTAQSAGEVAIAAVQGDTDAAARAVLDAAARDTAAGESGSNGDVLRVRIGTGDLLRLLAHAGASGGVHGRRRGAAAGRSLAWWVARCATGLDRAEQLDAEELEFRLEDLELIAMRSPGEAAWRLELAIGSGVADEKGEWAVAIAAFDRTEPEPDDPPADGAPWVF